MLPQQQKPTRNGPICGWSTIEGRIELPYIKRGPREHLVPVRLIEKLILAHYPSNYPNEIQDKPPLVCQFLSETEAELLSEVWTKSELGDHDTITVEDPVVNAHEFQIFFSIVRNAYPEIVLPACRRKRKSNTRYGWFLVKDAIIPYIMRAKRYLLPLNVIRGAANLLTESNIPVLGSTAEETTCLNEMCGKAGLVFTFLEQTPFVDLEVLLSYSPGCPVQELADDNPLLGRNAPQTVTTAAAQNQDEVRQEQQIPHMSVNQLPGIEERQHNNIVPNGIVSSTTLMNHQHEAVNGNSPDSASRIVDAPNFPVPLPEFMNMQNLPVTGMAQFPTIPTPDFANFSNIPFPGLMKVVNIPASAMAANQNIPAASMANVQSVPTNMVPNTPNIPAALMGSVHDVPTAVPTSNDMMSPALLGGNGILMTIPPPLIPLPGADGVFGPPPPQPQPALPSDMPEATPEISQRRQFARSTTRGRLAQRIRNNKMVVSHILEANSQPYISPRPTDDPNDTKVVIQPMECYGKTISCIRRDKQRTRYALVEAVCRVYFPKCGLVDFVRFLEYDLSVTLYTLRKDEETAFITFYGIPTEQLRCNQLIKLKDFVDRIAWLQEKFGPIEKTTKTNQVLGPEAILHQGGPIDTSLRKHVSTAIAATHDVTDLQNIGPQLTTQNPQIEILNVNTSQVPNMHMNMNMNASEPQGIHMITSPVPNMNISPLEPRCIDMITSQVPNMNMPPLEPRCIEMITSQLNMNTTPSEPRGLKLITTPVTPEQAAAAQANKGKYSLAAAIDRIYQDKHKTEVQSSSSPLPSPVSCSNETATTIAASINKRKATTTPKKYLPNFESMLDA